MSRAMLVLAGQTERAKAANWVAKAPINTRVEFKAPRRTLDQNSAMWLWLTALSEQLDWYALQPRRLERLYYARHEEGALDA